MPTLTYKAGDLEPTYVTTIKNANGSILDLTVATAVTFKAKLTTGSTTVTRGGSFVDRANGKVSFTWQTGDLAVIGIYDFEVEVTWAANRPSTHPNDKNYPLVIARKAQG